MNKKYYYSAIDIQGNSVEGSVEADSEIAAIIRLRLQGYYPTRVSLKERKIKKPQRLTRSFPFPMITLKEFLIFLVGVLLPLIAIVIAHFFG